MLYKAKIKIAGVWKMKHSRLFVANKYEDFKCHLKQTPCCVSELHLTIDQRNVNEISS